MYPVCGCVCARVVTSHKESKGSLRDMEKKEKKKRRKSKDGREGGGGGWRGCTRCGHDAHRKEIISSIYALDMAWHGKARQGIRIQRVVKETCEKIALEELVYELKKDTNEKKNRI